MEKKKNTVKDVAAQLGFMLQEKKNDARMQLVT